MKKLLLTLTAISGLLLNANAQKAYIRLGAGYGAPQAGQSRGIDGYALNGQTTYSGTSGFTAMKLGKASFGAGANISLAVGCMINDNFGIELGSLIGVASTKFKEDIYFSTATTSGHQTITQYANLPIFLLPSLIVQGGKKAKLYMKGGPVIPTRTKIESDITSSINQQGAHYDVTGVSILSNHLKLGVAAAVGVKIPIAKGVQLDVESNLISMSVYAKQEDITQYRINGQNVLQYITPTTYYKREYSGSNEGTYSSPFSSIGGSINIIFQL